MSKYINFGIDLGTTNSCITAFDGDDFKVIQNNDQMNVTPSVVRVLKSGSLMVGRRAYNAIIEDPDNVAAEFKRLMGQRYRKSFPASGRSMMPEELSAEVLKSVLADARRRTGEEARAAVITVPAAFTALQCEATARAAQLAGLVEYPLLQEPIAAAIAYGAKPGAHDQRWLVFDLGGGTLDVAVVSTRDGRLNVLEHRGDNHLGGKDFDRLIVQNLFLPHLARRYNLPDPEGDTPAYNRLVRKLTFLAEYAKIELSTLEETIVSFIDIGEDKDGDFIEDEMRLTRAQLEAEIQPLFARCLQLTDEALAGARLSGRDLDRVLLVGGPTQMPFIRDGLGRHLGAAVDYSLDPMTVVARGACIYGTTIERAQVETLPASVAATEKLPVRLAFDAVSSTTQAYVAGRINPRSGISAHEVKIDSDNGFWTSGWHPVRDELFDIAVTLQEGLMNRFRLSVRDAQGRTVEVEPAEFSIRHGLTISAPPLPHTISVELVQADGTAVLSPIFPRKTLLPAETTVSYRAAYTLRPSEEGTSLAIKLWEGEAHSDPQANNWVGNMHIRNEHIRRPIPEGVEIQLHIKIDASRLITVEAFVPHLNEHFTEKIFIPQDEEPDYLELLKGVPYEIESYFVRLSNLETHLLTREAGKDGAEDDFPDMLYEEGDFALDEGGHALVIQEESPREELERLRREIEDFDIEITSSSAAQSSDHDYAKGIVERSRELRVRIANLERRAGIDPRETRIEEAATLAREIGEDVTRYGNDAQKQRFDALSNDLRRAQERADDRGIKKAVTSLKNLRGQVLYAQDWFWKDWFSYMQRPGRRFVNTEEAARWLAQGERALAEDDRARLEEAVRWLWSLEPVEDREAEKERTARPGLRS